MEYVFFILIIVLLSDIESKVSNLKRSVENNRRISINEIKNLIGKKVCINIENDDISNSYMFSPSFTTPGIIKAINNEWLLFEYETKKEILEQYFRIHDIVSIDEIK